MVKVRPANFVIRWWRQWRDARRAAAQQVAELIPDAAAAKTAARAGRRAALNSTLEPLEGRIAPATLTPTTLTFVDLDGDTVTVKFSKALYNASTVVPGQLAAVKGAFFFSSDGATRSSFDDGGPQQLQLMNLASLPNSLLGVNPADRASITVSVKAGVTGDGRTDIGAIEAFGLTLGAVSIAGDLGHITVGDDLVASGLASLSVYSLGASSTSQSALNSISYDSEITGALGRLNVATHLYGYVHVVDGGFFNSAAVGKIGSVTIGGSIDGTGANKLGSIFTDHGITSIKVGTDPLQSTRGIFGGADDNTGSIRATGSIGSLSIAGSLVGGSATSTGLVSADGALGSLKVSGSITGGSGTNSGIVIVAERLGTARILGSITGAAGINSGSVHAGEIGVFTLGDSAADNLVGGTGKQSGSIISDSGASSVTVFGDVSGDGERSGAIFVGADMLSLNIYGVLSGGAGDFSGGVQVAGSLSAVKVGGSMLGADGIGSGAIAVGEQVGSLSVGGALVGGVGHNSGSFFAGIDFSSGRGLNSGKIAQGLVGGDGNNSGAVIVTGKLGTLTVGAALSGEALAGGVGAYSGSVYGATTVTRLNLLGDVVGGDGARSGAIQAQQNLLSATITGALTGGAGTYSGSIFSQSDPLVDQAEPGRLGNIQVLAGLLGGTGTHSGSIEAEGDLGIITVDSIAGGTGAQSGAVRSGTSIAESGSAAALVVTQSIVGGAGAGAGRVEIDGTLKSLKVGADISQSEVRAADSIGSVTIGGDLDQSTLSARGQLVQGVSTDVAFGSIKILGSVSNAYILAGYDLAGAALNADAQIGAVSVGGDWTASSLVAGVAAGSGIDFGQMSDTAIAAMGGTDSATIISRIASVKIAGALSGTSSSGTDHFGFVAQQIGAFQAGASAALALNSTIAGQVFEVGGANADVTVREVAIP